MGQTTAAVRATKKFPSGGVDLTETCTKCGAGFGEHDGQRCPVAKKPFVPATNASTPCAMCGHPLGAHVPCDPRTPDLLGPCPTPVPTSAPARFELLDLSKLGESALNPRKHFDEGKQAELDASVAARGVIEPLLVRPHGKVFEVVAGARRYRAAVAAKLQEVPCMVRDMSDAEALELAILENVCRADISAMDEGDAYRALIGLGQTVEAIVEKTGRSRTIVFARMKLAELQGQARELVLSGKWSASIGELIARLPTEKAQQAAMKRLEEKAKYSFEGLEGMTFRKAKEILDEEFVLHLAKAPFDVKDARLVDSADDCLTCPKRTHAPDNREQFQDVKADTCLDEACWNKKKAASFKALQAELAADGKKLVKEKNLLTRGMYGEKPTFSAAAAEKYSKPAETVVGEKTWKDLLGDEVPKVVVLDGDNKSHNLVDKKKALELLEEKDPKAAAKLREHPAKKEEDWEARRAAEAKKRAAEVAAFRVVRTKALGTVTRLEAALDLVIVALASSEWEWKSSLGMAGLPAKTKAEGLKPAQKVRLLLSVAFNRDEDNVIARCAKLVKLDVKALTKAALAAAPGTCFACGTPAPEKAICCKACGGEVEP